MVKKNIINKQKPEEYKVHTGGMSQVVECMNIKE
jgi:hypothetical protein